MADAEQRLRDLEKAEQRALWRHVHGAPFQIACAVVIFSNAMFIGANTQNHLWASINQAEVSSGWHLTEIIFNIWFCIELLLRMFTKRCLYFYGPEWKWNALDFVLVTLGVVDSTLALMGGSGRMANLTTARVVRLIRFIRIFRLARVIKVFQSFRVVAYAIIESIASLFWCFLVIGFIIYMFAIFFLNGVAEHFHGLDAAGRNTVLTENLLEFYGSVRLGMMTLWMTISEGLIGTMACRLCGK